MRHFAPVALCLALPALSCSPAETNDTTGTTTETEETCDPPPKGNAIPFVDGTQAWGLNVSHHTDADLCAITDTVGGPGVCAFDRDGDSDIDLYFVDRAGYPNRSLRNDGGTFTDITEMGGDLVDSDSHACLAFDFDGDGDLDIYVGNSGADTLLRNDGGNLVDVTAEMGLAETGFTTTMTAADIDLDGDLDLFVGHLVTPESCPVPICSPSPKACQAEANNLFINEGGQFVDKSLERGISHIEPTLASLFFDFDSDGDVDLFVGNDIGAKNPDRLYRNDGKGFFKDAAQGLGLELYGTDTMGIDVGDADGDGKVDMVTSDFELQPTRLVTCANEVLPCDMVGINKESTEYVNWAITLSDFDQDRDLDIFTTSGNVNVPPDYAGDKHQLHWNDGSGVFTLYEPSETEALGQRHLGRGAAFADIDGDLDLDIIIVNVGRPAQLLLNQAASGHAILVSLSTLSAGARVTAKSNTWSRTEHVLVGGSYAGSSDPRVHFGLGSTCSVDLEVDYLGGEKKMIKNVKAGEHVLVD